MELPPLPYGYIGDGYDYMDRLKGGWYAVANWGQDGWDIGAWPYQIVMHFDGDGLYGYATYTEGDLTVEPFTTRAARDQRTNEYFVWFWKQKLNVSEAPRDINDPRLGPYSV